MTSLDLKSLSYQQREYINYIGNNGREIAAGVVANDPAARRIIALYQMVKRQPSDPGAWGVLMGAVDEWISRQNERGLRSAANDSESP